MTKKYNASVSTDGIGGSTKLNPKGAPRVSAYEVHAQASKNLVAVRRVGRMLEWWDGEAWRNGYQTNYLMLQWLKPNAKGVGLAACGVQTHTTDGLCHTGSK
jgi:hypothetical protein